jgi:hypothetical protein
LLLLLLLCMQIYAWSEYGVDLISLSIMLN